MKLWRTMFMVLCAIILLNMLLAIILDNYMDVKRVSASDQSLTDQFHEMRRRQQRQKRKERMRLTDVWDHFVSEAHGRPKLALADERDITVDILQQMDQMGMPRSQAARTLQSSWVAHLKATTAPFELKHSAAWLARFETDIDWHSENAECSVFPFWPTRFLRYYIFARLDVAFPMWLRRIWHKRLQCKCIGSTAKLPKNCAIAECSWQDTVRYRGKTRSNPWHCAWHDAFAQTSKPWHPNREPAGRFEP